MGWRITAGVGDLTGLSLVAGICVADTVADLGVSNIRIKWPNDVLVNGQKLAGILVEAQPLNQSDGQLALVIGIGLNIHVSDRQAAGIEKTWCDLDHLADPPDRNVLIAALHTRMQLALRLFLADGFAPFKSRYSRVDELMGKQLALQVGSTVHRGCARGVDDSGRLLLQFPGGVQAFGSGHVISNVAD
jgi:BirA family biotin operon repressor/biotin-[acetyl-CoA-carboxylase] ligase